MSEPQTVTPPSAKNLPFPVYTLEEMRTACSHNALDTLKWRENADGTPHQGIDRIYVSMPNPALDLIVQSNRGDGKGNFSVFPAVDWQYKPHRATDAFSKILTNGRRAMVSLHAAIYDATIRGNTAAAEYDPNVSLAAHLHYQAKYTHITLQSLKDIDAAFETYMAATRPLIGQLKALAPLFDDTAPLTSFTEKLQRSIHISKQHSHVVRHAIDDSVASLKELGRLTDVYQAGEHNAAGAGLGNWRAKIHIKDQIFNDTIGRLSNNLMHTAMEMEASRNWLLDSMGMGPDSAIVSALRSTISTIRTRPEHQHATPPQQLLNTLNVVAQLNGRNLPIADDASEKPRPPSSWRGRGGRGGGNAPRHLQYVRIAVEDTPTPRGR